MGIPPTAMAATAKEVCTQNGVPERLSMALTRINTPAEAVMINSFEINTER
jgi:hypothetical protein